MAVAAEALWVVFEDYDAEVVVAACDFFFLSFFFFLFFWRGEEGEGV